MNRRHSDKNFVTTLSRGLQVIEAFDADAPEMTLSEVAAKTKLSPATARRCLLTLQALGYLGVVGRKYVPRPKMLSLGSAFLNAMNLRDVAQPFLQDVADRFHDSVSLAVLEDDEIVYLAHAPSKRQHRFRPFVGYRLPAYATALGHVLLAGAGEAEQKRFLARAPFPKYTTKTLSEAPALKRALAAVPEAGYAFVQDQFEYGVMSVAVPVTDTKGQIVAAINCGTDRMRVTPKEFVKTRLGPLKEAALHIGHALERCPALIHSVRSMQSAPSRMP